VHKFGKYKPPAIAEDQLTLRATSGFGRSITGSSAPFSLANRNSAFARGLPSAAAI
jgi:hypothetical protein